MNHDEHPTNSALAQSLQDSLSRLTVATRPPLAEITSRGRARQRRRRAGLAGFASLTGAAAGAALALSLTGALGAAPAHVTSTSTSSGASINPSTARTAAFILTSNANGTDSLTLTMGQVLDPGQLQKALTQHGIRAMVKIGTYCTSSPAAPDPVAIGVLTVIKRGGAPTKHIAPSVVTVINPAALPGATELFFGYSPRTHVMYYNLIYIKSHACSGKL